MEFSREEFDKAMRQGDVQIDTPSVLRFKVVCSDGTVLNTYSTDYQRAASAVLIAIQTSDQSNILGVIELP